MSEQPITREAAAAAVRVMFDYIRTTRPVWTDTPPTRPGYYFMRDRVRYGDKRPVVVEIREDFSEASVPLVVQHDAPATRGVEYLRSDFFEGCEWSGPLELPS